VTRITKTRKREPDLEGKPTTTSDDGNRKKPLQLHSIGKITKQRLNNGGVMFEIMMTAPTAY